MNYRAPGFVTTIFVEGLISRLHALLLQRLRSKSMQLMTDAIDRITAQMRDELGPAMDDLTFQMQRFAVTMLSMEPWYRHLRARWALRKSRRWSTVYPALQAE